MKPTEAPDIDKLYIRVRPEITVMPNRCRKCTLSIPASGAVSIIEPEEDKGV